MKYRMLSPVEEAEASSTEVRQFSLELYVLDTPTDMKEKVDK